MGIKTYDSSSSGMFSSAEQFHIHGLQHQARCLESLVATKEVEGSWFMTGTSDPGSLNELQVVKFEDSGDNIIYRAYKHSGMVMSLSPCPQDSRLVFTCHSTIGNSLVHGATLWQIAEDFTSASSSSTSPDALIKMVSFPATSAKTKKVLWDPTGFSHGLVQLQSQSAKYWSLNTDMTNLSLTKELMEPEATGEEISCGIWHSSSRNILMGRGADLVVCDVRSPSISSFDSSHQGGVLSIDGNPHLPYLTASGGRDGMVKFWDHRQPKEPLYQITRHTHWVWSIAINPQYDQLVLTGGSDCLVNLESINSLSSLSGLGADSSRGDKLVSSYTQHEDSVYGVSWSPSNPWLFASISFDGQLLFHRVPDQEKYNIIL